MYFADRQEAGRRLAQALEHVRHENVVVLGLPRGGVPVAAEIARTLHADLDVIVTRKLGAPGNPELAIGAVALHTRVLDRALVRALQVRPAYIDEVTAREQREVHRRIAQYRGDRPLPSLTGRWVVLVDDGAATGSTMIAAVRAVREAKPACVIVAIPVGSPEAVHRLEAEADEVVVLATPAEFIAVGTCYRRFDQVTDAEVSEVLKNTATTGEWPSVSRIGITG